MPSFGFPEFGPGIPTLQEPPPQPLPLPPLLMHLYCDRNHLHDVELAADGTSIELKRLYVDASWKGEGLAKRLMSAILEECKRRNANRLWLTVWEHNPRAIAFYNKVGFHVSGQKTFVLGGDALTDNVMELQFPQPT